MARLYLRKTELGFVPADENSQELSKKFKIGDVYRSDIVKPRSYKHHCLCMALLTITFENQEKYTNFDIFRKAVAIEAGHVNEIIKLDGEVVFEPASISYDTLDEVEFTAVFKKMMDVCCVILNDIGAIELYREVQQYASEHFGAS